MCKRFFFNKVAGTVHAHPLKLNIYTIRVPKKPFRVLDKLKNEIQNSLLRFCFYLNTKNEIQKLSTIFMFNRFLL